MFKRTTYNFLDNFIGLVPKVVFYFKPLFPRILSACTNSHSHSTGIIDSLSFDLGMIFPQSYSPVFRVTGKIVCCTISNLIKVKVQQGREEINSIGGISLISGLLNSLKIFKKVDSMRMNKVKTGKIKHSGILKTIAGLFVIGKNDYADVTPFHDDAFFRDCLKLPAVPSEETLHQRLDDLAKTQEIPRIIQFSNVEMLKKVPDFGSEKTACG